MTIPDRHRDTAPTSTTAGTATTTASTTSRRTPAGSAATLTARLAAGTTRTGSRHRPGRRAAAVALAVTVIISAGTGCGSGSTPDAEPGTAVAVETTTVPPTTSEPAAGTAVDGGHEEEPSAPGTLTVRADRPLAVHARPDDPAPVRTLPVANDLGSVLALLVVGQHAGDPTAAVEDGLGDTATWYEVLIPGRPNGATGWVRAEDVTVHRVSHAVEVDLASRTLQVLHDGELVLTTTVAVGAPDHPTPTGRFSLTDKVETPDPGGAYGPFALGLSGRSEVLTEFAGGDGQVGIHGTNDPSSIGGAVSHGCIRVPNDVAVALAGLLPLGTPVTIR